MTIPFLSSLALTTELFCQVDVHCTEKLHSARLSTSATASHTATPRSAAVVVAVARDLHLLAWFNLLSARETLLLLVGYGCCLTRTARGGAERNGAVASRSDALSPVVSLCSGGLCLYHHVRPEPRDVWRRACGSTRAGRLSGRAGRCHGTRRSEKIELWVKERVQVPTAWSMRIIDMRGSGGIHTGRGFPGGPHMDHPPHTVLLCWLAPVFCRTRQCLSRWTLHHTCSQSFGKYSRTCASKDTSRNSTGLDSGGDGSGISFCYHQCPRC